MLRLCFLIVLSLSIYSCSRSLSVRTDYFTQENLASFYVETPDPNLCHPFVNQRLILSWHLASQDLLQYKNLRLELVVRLRNHREEKVAESIRCQDGYYIFQLTQEQLQCSKGILTYKAEIWGDDCLLQSWQHPLWTELIQFNIPATQPKKPAFESKE